MGEFNLNAPTLLGLEHQARFDPAVRLDSALAGLAMRFRSPGTPTVARAHPYVQTVAGNPGLAVEIVDELLPEVTFTDFYPGTDTGSTVTGWVDHAAGAANFGEIDDQHDASDYHTNSAALSRQSTLVSDHRGNNAGALTGQRILRVDIGVSFRLLPAAVAAGNDPSVPLRARLVLDGVTHRQAPFRPQASPTPLTRARLGSWARNPGTGLPWTEAEVDDILDPADADTFGVEVGGRLAASGFRLIGRWLRVWHCAENRVGFYYQGGQPADGWTERTLTATAALTADTSYWYVIYPLTGGPGDLLRVPRPRDPQAVLDDDGAGNGEHRSAYELKLFSQGGCAVEATEIPGGLLPVLLDSGAIETPSQPYAQVDELDINRDETAGTDPGQQVTATVGTTYAAVMATVGWANPQHRPDRPLTIEVRSGSVAGALIATATLHQVDTRTGVRQVIIPLDAAFPSAGVQYHLVVASQASVDRSWRLYRLDTRSDDIGSGTTAAEIQGASQGGTTDSWFVDGASDDRYDLPLALVASPPGPAGLTATVRSAA